ncbi:MAG: cyclic nucleotide-binding domain-containing protein [Gammaproteobacteria bacterium]|nr:cyclic nucleotide-binding domain-containing protein [Gammaproteobacteria bacterium]
MNNPEQHSNKSTGQDILRNLIPLNALTEEHYQEIAGSLAIEDVSAGSYLFGQGDHDNRSVYLLDGVINLINQGGKVTGVVSAGTDPARYPIANRQPRMMTARAATKSVIAWIDSTLLDVMLTLDQSVETGAVKISAHTEQDWMSRMLRSEAFSKLPPSDIQRLIQALEPVPYSAGDTVIRQGDDGDYFYIIREGSCSVTRLASGKGWDVPLAELNAGDCFGEDALVSDGHRNASVTMLTDGSLMRLSKQQFLDILKKQLVHYVTYDLAQAAIKSGERWLDVRLAEEHTSWALENSINIPLATVRANTSRLDKNLKYVVYCDTGRRSAAAAFLLTQRGFSVSVLEGGMNESMPGNDFNNPAIQPQDAGNEESNSIEMPTASVTPFQENTGGQPAASTEASPPERQRLGELEAEVAAIKTELQAYTDTAEALEEACKSERQARNSLTESITALLNQLK